MKFGRILEERRIKDWRYINYDHLKLEIKKLDGTQAGANSFHDMVSAEISEVDAFFKQKQEVSEKGQAQECTAVTLAALRSHALLNYLAVLKILKKHVKWSQKMGMALGESAQEIDTSSVKQQLFETSIFLAISSGSALILQAENAPGLRHRCRSRASSSGAFACPVCYEDMHDSAMLPCSHRFCRSCLARCATQGINSCPLCRKEQTLDPVSLEIESILGCCAQQYFATNQQPFFTHPSLDFESDDSFHSQMKSEDDVDKCCSGLADLAGMSGYQRGNICTEAMPLFTTPRVNILSSSTTPPGAPAMGTPSIPSLFHALRCKSLEKVRSVLEFEPDAAFFPPLEHRREPSLCCAVRHGCSVEIMQLLLQHGAQAKEEDAQGKTPLMLLSSMPLGDFPTFFDFSKEADSTRRQWSIAVASLLIGAGAEPMSRNRSHPSCVELASRAQNYHLVLLYGGEHDPAAQVTEEAQDFPPTLEQVLAKSRASFWQPWTMSEPPAVRISGM